MKATIVIELKICGETQEATLKQVADKVNEALPGAGNVIVESIAFSYVRERPR